MLRFLSEWKAMRRFQALPKEKRELVFYAETKADWVYFEPILKELLDKKGKTVCYLTSDADDPVLAGSNPRILPFYIGSGMVCTMLFRALDAKVMVITLTDLDSFNLKRSAAAPVHYVYVFHSMVSSHRAFRKEAYKAYDTVLCVGPHHVREIRRAEEVFGWQSKSLVEHGYGRLDSIMANAASRPPFKPSFGPSKKILIAPSWGGSSISNHCAGELIDVLLNAGHQVTFRPHPMTVRQEGALIDKIRRDFGSQPKFVLETDVRSADSLHAADLMVSDWSGAALEFAFGLERPVLFIDTPNKINNPEYEKLGLEALEVFIRSEVGAVIALDQLAQAPAAVEKLCKDPAALAGQIRKARASWVFNVGQSGAAGARAICNVLNGAKQEVISDA
jgi:YidC/Oxa1 family membrane protein insertase